MYTIQWTANMSLKCTIIVKIAFESQATIVEPVLASRQICSLFVYLGHQHLKIVLSELSTAFFRRGNPIADDQRLAGRPTHRSAKPMAHSPPRDFRI